ncbi:uncharacterized protein BX664DRAFT_329731 [Halteromyces radiatus]|uniref:uncharacterized protein n=1 Tax=Halteromyces radiatus TaxID=101107 RepID=UPI0022203F55|nr:uncharacterized protein BX664DRAFT_329731 [Halteromyces radiatus]KAI8093446.1 hypothetical protein BX664DRAFT_329731 [Halteromyces radiatus]
MTIITMMMMMAIMMTIMIKSLMILAVVIVPLNPAVINDSIDNDVDITCNLIIIVVGNRSKEAFRLCSNIHNVTVLYDRKGYRKKKDGALEIGTFHPSFSFSYYYFIHLPLIIIIKVFVFFPSG